MSGCFTYLASIRGLQTRSSQEPNFIVLEGDPGYIITSDGPARVLGSSAPLIENMSDEEREGLLMSVKS